VYRRGYPAFAANHRLCNELTAAGTEHGRQLVWYKFRDFPEQSKHMSAVDRELFREWTVNDCTFERTEQFLKLTATAAWANASFVEKTTWIRVLADHRDGRVYYDLYTLLETSLFSRPEVDRVHELERAVSIQGMIYRHHHGVAGDPLKIEAAAIRYLIDAWEH